MPSKHQSGIWLNLGDQRQDASVAPSFQDEKPTVHHPPTR